MIALGWLADVEALAYVIGCMWLAWSVVGRIDTMDHCTHWRVRWAFLALFGASLCSGAGCLIGMIDPAWPDVLLVYAMVSVQTVVSRYCLPCLPAGRSIVGRRAATVR